ncbi:BC1872 family protein [Shouchella rhizosphaerae]|uniref:BC1872 family protein n=1 Tax=Shouchella rhizosphaerae TaxID=866786 RepID=UPI003F7FD996
MDVDSLYDYDENDVKLCWDMELAEKIMGWKVLCDNDNRPVSVYDEVNETSYFIGSYDQREWSPVQNIEQAFQVLEKVKCAWQIQSSKEGYRVCLQVHNPDFRPSVRQIQMEEETLADAICQAVLAIPDSYLILREDVEQ